jgi:hypothetical protein
MHDPPQSSAALHRLPDRGRIIDNPLPPVWAQR